MTDHDAVVRWYRERYRTFLALTEDLKRLVEGALSEAVDVNVDVKARAKDPESLQRKLALKHHHIDDPQDLPRVVQDLCGLRITVPLRRDRSPGSGVLQEALQALAEGADDDAVVIEEKGQTDFGYSGVHVNVRLSEQLLRAYDVYFDFPVYAELQVRSHLEHAFADIQHDFGYHDAANLTADVQQTIREISGSLRLVERVFEQLAPTAQAPEPTPAGGSGNDLGKFSWEGAGRLSKWDTLQRIARRFVTEHEITTKAAFDEQFGAAVQRAVGDAAERPFRPEHLTYESDDPSTAFVLDGTPYAIEWWCGYNKHPAIGRRIHRPVIEWFGRQGYPVEEV